MGTEQPASFYNKVYRQSKAYQGHYSRVSYFPVWAEGLKEMVISVDEGFRPRLITDLGCGPGQYADFLYHNTDNINYTGYDFSKTAIRLARVRGLPTGEFWFREKDIFAIDFKAEKPDIVVAHETFEHIEKDLELITRIEKETQVIFSLPSFDCEGHCRHFKNTKQITDRYAKLFWNFKTVELLDWFVCSGFRNDNSKVSINETPAESAIEVDLGRVTETASIPRGPLGDN